MKEKFLFILILIITGCGTTKKDLSFNTSFENGNEKINFEVLSNKQVLKLNKTNKTRFILKNIDKSKVSISGKSIRTSENNKLFENEIHLDMSPNEEDLVDGRLNVFLTYKMQEKLRFFKLQIPVE